MPALLLGPTFKLNLVAMIHKVGLGEGTELHPGSYIGSGAWLINGYGPRGTALKFKDSR